MKGQRVLLSGHFNEPVLVEDVRELGYGFELRVRLSSGQLKEVVLSKEEYNTISALEPRAPEKLVDAESLRLLVESNRIRLAYSYDPHFAVSLSGIRTLPHQIEAVYMKMLPQPRLRFLLADDPGAGKTIMAGLLLKEMKLRQAIERILIVVPAALTIQWQDEFLRFFNEPFTIISSALDQRQLVDPWQRESQVIVSLDYAKMEDIRERIWQQHWDAVVIDEAHKCSAHTKRRTDRGPEMEKTKRYQLAERLTGPADHVLLLTATPHHGDDDRFGHFLRLLDPDLFPEPHLLGDQAAAIRKDILRLGTNCPWAIRRMKEELRDLNGRRLFPDRHSITVTFPLSPEEYSLYRLVTGYINQFLPRGYGRQKQSMALTRTVFQRRLASSTRAIHESLKRRYEKMRNLLEELESLAPEDRARRLEALRRGIADEELEEDDLDERMRDKFVDEFTAATELEALRDEVASLKDIVEAAGRVREHAPDSKLAALREALQRAEFQELRDGRGKLLIFTEHRDTMEHVKEHLEHLNYTTCTIHGGMNVFERKAAQEVFRTQAQVCVATEAAGEGINLQFCHLMINYDLPWNPMRLEQRMGRIHRIGQERDVYAFNFVADRSVDGEPVIEGQILRTLLEKIDRIRVFMHDRVFDVIGEILALNDVNLPEMLREAAYDPRLLDGYLDQIQRVDAEKLKQYENATGIALARAHVDLSAFQQANFQAEEKRLMPEYVARFFLAAASRTGLRVEARADGLWRVEHVPQDLRSDRLEAVKRLGKPLSSYRKVTFYKEHLEQSQHVDAVLLGPGHSLYAVVDEVLNEKLANFREGVGVFVDSSCEVPYWLHFYVVEIEGDPLHGDRREVIYAEFVAVREEGDELTVVPPDVFHDLVNHPSPPANVSFPSLQQVQDFLKGQYQLGLRRRCLEERSRFVDIARDYLAKSFEARIRAAEDRVMALRAREAAGERTLGGAIQNAEQYVVDLERSRDGRLRSLDRLGTARTGPVRHVASFLVVPASMTEATKMFALGADPESEVAAMDVVMKYERDRNWEPADVSKHNLGFDIRSLGPPDLGTGKRDVRRIEVKGRRSGQPVRLTTNEWLKARQLRDTYWLYVVWDPKKTGASPLTLRDPAHKLEHAVREILATRFYEIPAEALEKAAKEAS